MGKKVEKGLKDKDKAASAKGHQGDDNNDDENKTPEPHVCTGHFSTDFSELCRRNQMAVIPPVVQHPHRPPSPSQITAAEEKKGGKGKDKNPQPEPEPEPELNEDGEPVEPPPKTYTTKEKFEYFKPTVQVEMENPDKLDTVNEVIVRGWKIDEPMMTVFKQCWVAMEKLHTITLWNAGLTGETLGILGSFLPLCANVKLLSLDGNHLIRDENFDVLLGEDSLIQHLSLRYCCITDKGAANIGKSLGSAQKQNSKLVSLNLTGNRIGDVGATHIAHALRMNRSLLSLSLASNKISDEGTKKFAEALSRFALSHEEVVERRKLMSEKGSPLDRQKSPPPSRRADSKDRPGSVRSSSHADKDKNKRDKSSKKKGEKDEKLDKTKGTKGGKDDKTVKKGASVVAETGKTMTKGKDKKGKDKKGTVAQEQEPETPDLLSPLLEPVENINGNLWIPGNRILLSLNLARNEITDEGVKAILLAVQYQVTLSTMMKSAGTGLMRIALHKNPVAGGSESMMKLGEIMLTKDPFYKPPPSTPDQEQS